MKKIPNYTMNEFTNCHACVKDRIISPLRWKGVSSYCLTCHPSCWGDKRIMKQIEAIVPINVSRNVIKSIRDLGVSGVTLVESRGQGEGERPELQGKQAEFNPTDLIISVVEDSQLEDIVSAIIDTAHTGEKTDGKIFISEVKMTYDIATKLKSTQLI